MEKAISGKEISDALKKGQKRLETLLVEGLESGEATEMNGADWEDIRQAVRSRLAKHKQANGQG